MNRDKFHGHYAWIRVHKFIRDDKISDEVFALALWCYLSTFGMMRGSSKFAKKDAYFILTIINLLRKEEKTIFNESFFEQSVCDRTNISICLIEKIKNYLEHNGVSATDTLLSKILLPTVCCIPALDKYVKENACKYNLFQPKLDKSGVKSIYDFLDRNGRIIANYSNQYGIPPARVLDICLCAPDTK